MKIITAAMLAIGDELLSGRTKDKNIGHLAAALTLQGIDLEEVRIVGDTEEAIVEAVNALRQRYDLVFTSGGIGPTHDDITADAIAKAFGVSIGHDPRAMKILSEHYAERDMEFTDARKRMARLPEGSELIENPVSKAPGFIIENVHVMAGVPSVFQVMLQRVLEELPSGQLMQSQTIECGFGEGTIGGPLGTIQADHPDTSIGSYPKFDGKNFSTQIVIRGRDEAAIRLAEQAVHQMLKKLEDG